MLVEAAMLTKLMISAAISALMVSGAMAQANPPANPPTAKTDAAPVDSAKFIQAQGTDQWVFSKFKGTDVIGPGHRPSARGNALLFDKRGKIVGLDLGVGGFLGKIENGPAAGKSSIQALTDDTGSSAGGNTAV